MTGATGTVGIPLFRKLKEQGHHIFCLVRSMDGKVAIDRFEEIMGEACNCGIVEGDITQVNCGLNDTSLELLKAFRPDVALHVAADVRMDSKREAEVRTANISGTVNVLALARTLGIRNIHYISTAYVENGKCNVYEISKAEAENVVRDSGLNYTISRISIVVGDYRSGVISGFTGYYGFFMPFVRMARSIRAANGIAAAKPVRIPVTIKVLDTAKLNLIPIDWAAKMLAKITLRPASNRTLLVTHPNPPLTVDVIRDTLFKLNIKGVRVGSETISIELDQSHDQEIYNRVMQIFEPYVTKPTVFDGRGLREFLGEEYEEPPEFDRETFGRLINYALAVNFGKK